MKFAKNHSLACCEYLGEVKWPLSYYWYSIFKCDQYEYLGVRLEGTNNPWRLTKKELMYQKEREYELNPHPLIQMFYETVLDMILGSETN